MSTSVRGHFCGTTTFIGGLTALLTSFVISSILQWLATSYFLCLKRWSQLQLPDDLPLAMASHAAQGICGRFPSKPKGFFQGVQGFSGILNGIPGW